MIFKNYLFNNKKKLSKNMKQLLYVFNEFIPTLIRWGFEHSGMYSVKI